MVMGGGSGQSRIHTHAWLGLVVGWGNAVIGRRQGNGGTTGGMRLSTGWGSECRGRVLARTHGRRIGIGIGICMSGRDMDSRGWRVGRTIVHAAVDQVGAGLLVAIEDRRLHLLKILVNLEQVSFCAQITHGWEVVWLDWCRSRPISMTADGNHRWRGLIFNGTAGDQRHQTVKGVQTGSDGVIGTEV